MTDFPKPLKIVSDGYTHTTKIIDQETGRELPWVKSVTWKAEAGTILNTVVVEFVKMEIDVVTKVEED